MGVGSYAVFLLYFSLSHPVVAISACLERICLFLKKDRTSGFISII
jgi:hypothetical protein